MVLVQVLTFEKMARPVWLVPYYTEDIDKACTSFKVIPYGQKGYDPQFKIPVGLESRRYPCLISICDQDVRSKVSHVQLVQVTIGGMGFGGGMHASVGNIRETCKATGVTDCLLSSAGGGYLYLMWK